MRNLGAEDDSTVRAASVEWPRWLTYQTPPPAMTATRKPITSNIIEEDCDLGSTSGFAAVPAADSEAVFLSSALIAREEMQFESRSREMRNVIAMISTGGNH